MSIRLRQQLRRRTVAQQKDTDKLDYRCAVPLFHCDESQFAITQNAQAGPTSGCTSRRNKHNKNISSICTTRLSGKNRFATSTLCPKKRARFNLLQLGKNLTGLQYSFSVRKSMKLNLFPDRMVPELIT